MTISKEKYIIASTLLFIVAFFLRYFSLETNGLWIDEIWSMQTSAKENTVSQIIELCMLDTHPPLFDILLHYCLVLTNDAEFTGRNLALIIGMIGIFASSFYAFKITKSRAASLLTTAILSFNFFHIIYSFEGRFYTLLYLFSLIVIAELFLYFKNNQAKSLIFFSVVMTLFLYTHYYGAILLFVLSAIVFVLFVSKTISRKQFFGYCKAALICFIFFLPWLPQMLAKKEVSSWMSTPSIGNFFNYFYLYTGKNPFEFILLFLPLLLSFKLFNKHKLLFSILIGCILLGFLVPFVISNVSTPMLHYRYTFIYFPAVVLLAAIFWYDTDLINVKVKKIGFSIVVLSIIGNLFFLRKNFYEGNKDPWKEIAIYMKNTAPKIVLTEHSRYLNYYLKNYKLPEAKQTDYINSDITGSFWFLETGYDQRRLMNEGALVASDTIGFDSKFNLYKVQKTK